MGPMAVLGAAHAATRLHNVIKEPFVKRRTHHWSQTFVAFGATVALVSSVAAFILGNYPIVAASALVFTTHTIAWFFLRRFIPVKALSGYVHDLQERITQLSQNNSQLQVVNRELTDKNADLKLVNQSLEESELALKELHRAFVKEQLVLELAKKEALSKLQKKTEQFEQIVLSLDKKKQEYQRAELLYQKVKAALDSMSSQVSAFNKAGREFREESQVLQSHAAAVKAMGEGFAVEIRALEGLTEEEKQSHEQLATLVEKIHQEIASLEIYYQKIHQENVSLQQQADRFAEENQTLQKTISDLKETREAIEESLSDTREAISDAETRVRFRMGLGRLAGFLKRKKKKKETNI